MMVLRLAALGAALCTLTVPVLGQEACPADPVSVDFAHAGGNRFTVTVAAPGSHGDVDILWRPGAGTPDGTADFLSDLRFRDTDGAVVAAQYAGQGTWQHPGGADAAWDGYSYTLTADHDRAEWQVGKEETAYRFDDAFYFVGHPVLALNYAWEDCRFDIGFDLPAGWTSVAAWPQTGPDRYAVDGLNDVVRNIFVVGPGLEPQTIDVDGMAVTLLAQDALADGLDDFRQVLADSLSRYAAVFGGVPMPRYLVVFGEGAMNDGGAFAQSFGQRMPAPFRPHERLMWARTLSHETLHAWLGITIRPDPWAQSQWFTEGGADYLSMKTLYRGGLVDAHDVIFMLEGQIRRFFLGRMASGPVSLAEAGENKQQNRQLVYGGGALFHYLLDARMTAQSGPGAYEAALGRLYSNADRSYSQARLLAELDAASDGAASEILAMLNGSFNPFAVLAEMDATGLSTAAFGPDEILVRFAAGDCEGSREPACMPAFLRR
jgi:predicted metalloprotease with PDZ domain